MKYGFLISSLRTFNLIGASSFKTANNDFDGAGAYQLLPMVSHSNFRSLF
jgi:hypothetical protein